MALVLPEALSFLLGGMRECCSIFPALLTVHILENTNIFQAVFCLRFQHGTHGDANETAAAALTESLQACKQKTFASIFGKPQKLHRFLEVMRFLLLLLLL